MLNLNLIALIVPELSTFMRTDMANSTRLLIGSRIYILYVIRNRSFGLLPIFLANPVYPFSLRVAGLEMEQMVSLSRKFAVQFNEIQRLWFNFWRMIDL